MIYSTNISSYPETDVSLPFRDANDIIETMYTFNDKLGDLAHRFVIVGGANLVLRGIKETTVDVDMLVADEVFEAMKSMDGAIIKQPPLRAQAAGATNTSVWIENDWTKIPLSGTPQMGDGYFPMSYEQYDGRSLVQVHGLPLAPIEDVWGSKIALQRPRDLRDLLYIAEVTGKSLNLPPPVYRGPAFNS